jgi:hypothetical protein
MEDNTTTAADFLLDSETILVKNTPFVLGLISISALVLSFLIGYVLFSGIGLILFAGSFVLSIIGLVVASKYKKQYPNISAEQRKKIQIGKTLSLATLILASLAIMAVTSLIIIIGNQGFGR